jgi:hypothetical protein
MRESCDVSAYRGGCGSDGVSSIAFINAGAIATGRASGEDVFARFTGGGTEQYTHKF